MSTSTSTSTSFIREVKPVVAPKAVVAQEPEKPAVRMHMGSKVMRTETITNHSGIVMERLFTEDGKRHRVYHYPPPVFRHPSDNYLAMILSTPPDAVMPPLPDLSHDKNLETQFRESLKDEIVIGEGDSEEVKEIKERVILARESMKQLLDQGRKFAEVIEEERRIFNENHDLRAMVVREYAELVRGDTIDNAESYRLAMNKKLAEMGIEEVPLKVKKDNRKSEQKGK